MTRIPLWIDLRRVPVNKRLSYFKAIADANVEAILIERGDPHSTKTGVAPVVVGADGQLRKKGKRIGRLLDVNDQASQAAAGRAKGIVIADGKNWRVIPLENLIAMRQDRPGTLFTIARTVEEARLFATTLEVGVHGLVYAPASVAEITSVDGLLRKPRKTHAPQTAATQDPAPQAYNEQPSPASEAPPGLKVATVRSISDAGLGDRVCVDTTSLLREGEGLLVGSTAQSLVLIHAETESNDLIPARPFRVNAGALHMYVLAPQERTNYLSELQAGSSVLIAHRDGSTRTATVGRSKIERRPHMKVEWQEGTSRGSAVLQTAETVCLIRPTGERVAVTALKPGDEILVRSAAVARHAGTAITASVEER